MARILIGGSPRVGKTTLMESIRSELVHVSEYLYLSPTGMPTTLFSSDDLRHELSRQAPHADAWKEAPASVLARLASPGHAVVEGVMASRALRSWLRVHPQQRQFQIDAFVWMGGPEAAKAPQLRGQRAMGKGVTTIFRGVEDAAKKAGVQIVEAPEARSFILGALT